LPEKPRIASQIKIPDLNTASVSRQDKSFVILTKSDGSSDHSCYCPSCL